jgi:hypothetical protein
MALADIWRTIAIHGMAGGAGVALWFGTQPPRSAGSGQEQAGLATARERSVEVQLRGRDLADGASEEHGDRPVTPPWVPRTARQLAEESLGKRDEMIAVQQADAMVRVAAAGKYSTDKRLLEKIEEALFTGGDDEEAAAMMLAFVLQDEERALAEAGRRGALLDALSSSKVLAGVEAAALERWAAREDLPEDLRMRALSNLAGRLGPGGDLEGVARVWDQTGSPGLREDFIKAFERHWICDDGAEAVGIIFNEWPEALRLQFLEKLDWFHDGARPIWTKTLVEAMRDAPWDTVPEELAERVLGEIKRSDETSIITNVTHPEPRLSSGMEEGVARWQIRQRIDGLLADGPDLREQLADGRIDVEGFARRLGSRLSGSQLYPAAFAEVVFAVCAGIDPVGALSYSRGKIAPGTLDELGGEVLRKVEDDEWCLDRMLATSALLPASKGKVDRPDSSGGADPVGDFVVWHSLAPERATEALDALPKGHPLRRSIETALNKEGSR